MQSNELKEFVIKELDDLKAQDVTVLDVNEQTEITDFMVVATGTSSRHIGAMASRLTESAKKAGIGVFGTEGDKSSDWILVDMGDVIVHLMLAQAREFYQIEKLWDLSMKAANERPASP